MKKFAVCMTIMVIMMSAMFFINSGKQVHGEEAVQLYCDAQGKELVDYYGEDHDDYGDWYVYTAIDSYGVEYYCGSRISDVDDIANNHKSLVNWWSALEL